jgi:hypothetical protein
MSVLKQIKLFAFLLLVLAAGYGCYTLYQSTVPASRFSQEPTPDAVLKSVKSLARLETVTYTVEKIVDISASGPQSIIKDFLFGDKLLLIATGDVIAGVDLQRMNQSDVSISGNQITIQLPPAEIFTVGLNEPQTRVYDRKTGLLTQKPLAKIDLQAASALSFSKNSRFISVRAGAQLIVFDNEFERTYRYDQPVTGSTSFTGLPWMDGARLQLEANGHQYLLDYDGINLQDMGEHSAILPIAFDRNYEKFFAANADATAITQTSLLVE